MKLRNLILGALFACLGATASAQTAGGRSLEAIVAEAATHCPQKIDQGSSIDAVSLTDDAVEMRMTMAVPAAQFPVIKQNLGMMRPTLLKMMGNAPDMRSMFALASQNGKGMRIVISCADDAAQNFTLDYSAKELADVIK